MVRFILASVALFSFAAATAQHEHGEPCRTDVIHKRMMQNDPEYRRSIEMNEELIREIYREQAKSRSGLKSAVVTIPIVFHIIHKGEAVGTGSNISDAQIQSAIDGMNIQYRNKYADGTIYDADGVDLEMEFCLAQRDPSGLPTTGINRVNGTSVTNYSTQGITDASSGGNEAAVKALSRWDNKKYYNVWVVAMINGQDPTGGGVQGYAYFPGAPGTVDGTVVLYNACGYCPSGSCPGFNLKSFARDNGTMVHEIGHAFALYHTFEGGDPNGGSCPPTETNCATQGDRVCDTDPHRSNLGTCKTVGSINDCVAGGTYNVRIARNYMNYTNCSPLIFTPGQRDRVQAQFATSSSPRYSLTVSDGCDPVFTYDLAVKKILTPKAFYCENMIPGSIQVKNTGSSQLTSFKIEYGVDGTVLNTYTWTGTLDNNQETVVNLPAVPASTATHTFFARVVKTSLNGTQTDGYAPNDNASGSFEVITGTTLIIDASNYQAGDKVEFKKVGGSIVNTVSLDDGGSSYSGSVCLPNDCYDIILTDAAWAPASMPSIAVKDKKGYTIASGISAFPGPPGNILGTPKSVTTPNKCIPFNPGYVEADFKADKLIIEQGTVVQFTDLTVLSAGSPATATNATQWEWSFGDGGTDFTQNPAHLYNTPGVYTVRLIADNSIAPDTAEKLHYIRVLPKMTGCDQFGNLISGESPTIQTTVNGLPGYYPGPNILKPNAYAERFWTPVSSKLKSVELFVTKRTFSDPATEATITIYSNAPGGKPGTAMRTEKVTLSSLVEGQYNTVPITTMITVPDVYYIAVQMNYNPGDTLVLGASDYRGAGDLSNTAYIFASGQWNAVPDAVQNASANSLAIRTNLSFIPVAKWQMDALQTCEGKDILYDASISQYVSSYSWSFEDGTPATSNLDKLSVTYFSMGEKNVKLVAKGGCDEEEILETIIKVAPKPSLAVTKIDEVCQGSNGSAVAVPEGGSGSYSFQWTTNPQQITAKATQLKKGSYTVTMTDLKCGTVVETIDIDNLNELPSFPVDIVHTSCGANNGIAKPNPFGGTGNYTYTWTKQGDPNFFQTAKILYNLSAGTYYVEVSDGSCNPRMESVVIDPSVALNGTVSASKTSLCQGETTTLTATGGYRYEWSSLSDTLGTDASFDITPGSSNIYTVKIYDNTVCMQKLSVPVTVIKNPIALAGVDIDRIDEYLEEITADLKDGGYVFYSSAGSDGTHYTWSFGDGDTSYSKNPIHRYTATGVYQVILEVAVIAGSDTCRTLDTCKVTVIDSRTGIDQVAEPTLSVYPNPSSGLIHIANPGKTVINSVRVIDLMGREVKAAPRGNSLDLSFLSNGVYTLVLTTETGDTRQRIEILK